jgi:hypothetical protein
MDNQYPRLVVESLLARKRLALVFASEAAFGVLANKRTDGYDLPKQHQPPGESEDRPDDWWVQLVIGTRSCSSQGGVLDASGANLPNGQPTSPMRLPVNENGKTSYNKMRRFLIF